MIALQNKTSIGTFGGEDRRGRQTPWNKTPESKIALHNLQIRQKWQTKKPNIKTGDIVILSEELKKTNLVLTGDLLEL